LHPEKSRYWLNPKEPERLAVEAKPVCEIYLDAPALHAQGIHVVSTDEKTGMQALERIKPTKPTRPGLIERFEYEYKRHGTLCLIANFMVATGQVVAPSIGPTRTEQDFAAHIERTVDADPEAGWVFVADQLDTHMSETIVRLVAERIGYDGELGIKGRNGILKSRKTRKQFLTDTGHRIRFVYTPKHCSWLNQVEIWFSILSRRLLRRGSFTSLEDLHHRLLKFIAYFNAVLAKPFKWTYTGRALRM